MDERATAQPAATPEPGAASGIAPEQAAAISGGLVVGTVDGAVSTGEWLCAAYDSAIDITSQAIEKIVAAVKS